MYRFLAAGSFVWFFMTSTAVYAQDPRLPATNLGQVNLQDGNPPGTGWIYQQAVQAYSANKSYGADGKLAENNSTTTLLALQQIIRLTETKFLGGNVGFTAMLPIVRIADVSEDGKSNVTTNPSPVGDLIAGAMIQWFDQRIGNMKLAHRLELDGIFPTGAYDSKFIINPSSHFYTLSLHHTFTMFPAKHFAFSMRNHVNYNTRIIGSAAKAGMFYNTNYSFEYALSKAFSLEATGYYLQQFVQDSFNGDHRYYQNTYGIRDTRERVFAYGLGIGYRAPMGAFIELKGVQETDALNRTQGFRGTVLVNFKIH